MEENVELLEGPIIPEELPEPNVSEVPREVARPIGFSARVRMALALILSVTTVFCKIGNPDSAKRLQQWIVGDGSERVQQAFFRLEEALGEGETVSDAWTVFCQELTDETA